ncbi:MAG: hypothetical protein DI640_14075 [Sphingomonas taxi]|uniref:O-antigen ligase-related domain-containing protein n=1 Tax=Sphingomonas taxi TaxID=1549858 RepID=A0A2W4YQB0_9SPHN|nr:MAG: hypothetical protein DI640_14075 [Sphingomonas taxi]
MVLALVVWLAYGLSRTAGWPAIGEIALVHQSRDLLGLALEGSATTLDPSRFTPSLVSGLVVFATLCSAILLGQDRNRSISFLHGFLLLSTLTTLLTLGAFAAQPRFVLWHEKTTYLRDFTLTFVNRGAAGAWLCLSAGVALAFLVRHLIATNRETALSGGSLGRRIVAVALERPTPMVAHLLAVALPVCGLLLTQSRAALVILGIDLALLLLFVWLAPEIRTQTKRAATIALLLATVVTVQVAASGLSARVAETGFLDEGRLAIWQATMIGIRDAPWFGYGPGTFPEGFAAYRSVALEHLGEIRSAHSLPLELAFELGLPLAIGLLLVWAGLVLSLAAGLRRRPFDVVRACGLLAAVTLTGAVSVDVASQTLGFVVPALAVFGLSLGQTGSRAWRRRTGRRLPDEIDAEGIWTQRDERPGSH